MSKRMKKGFGHILVITIISLCFCNCKVSVEPPHEHTFTTKWSSDDEYHWHASTCEHKEEVSEKSEHTYGDWTVTKAATETEKGSKEKVCSECAYKVTEGIDILPHTNHVAGTQWQKDNTNHWKLCTFNGCTQKMEEESHSWNSGIITTQPTCTTDGVRTYTCTICSATKAESMSSEHTYSNLWTYNETHHWHEPSCGHNVEIQSKSEHTFGSWQVTESSTETKEGCKCRICVVCSFQESATIPKLTHTNHTAGTEWQTNETYHWKCCTFSGCESKLDFSAHKWNNKIVITEPGCITSGIEVYSCEECKITKTVNTAPKGHTFSTVWISDDTYHWQVASCEHNTEIRGKTEHTWNNGIVTTLPTCTTPGIKTYTCTICSQTKTETVSATGHTGNFGDNCPSCNIVNNTFGRWPQTLKASDVTVTETGTKWDDLDLFIGSDGEQYVKYTSSWNRPAIFGNGEPILINTPYYFKFEPIEWEFIENSEGQKKVIAKKILVSGIRFYGYTNTRTLNGAIIYCNNYKYSDVRAYLNGKPNQIILDGGSPSGWDKDWTNKGFYDLAFTDEEKAKIAISLVDNSGSNKYACQNTSDKIFILSESEAKNLKGILDITKVATDFALVHYYNIMDSQGGSHPVGPNIWSLRTPGSGDQTVRGVGSSGSFCNITLDYYGSQNEGLVPVLVISE